MLQKVVKAKKRSSAGPDGWAYKHLALLPLAWHNVVAEFMNWLIDGQRQLPAAWISVRVTLIPRPISIAAAMWRLMGSCMLREMATWLVSWVPEEVVGGIS